MPRRLLPAALLSVAALLAAASPASAAPPATCGAPTPDRVVEGTFTADQTGSFVMVPFDVPPGTTAVRAWYCYDAPESPTASLPAFSVRHTIDFGLYGPRPAGRRMWTMDEYRGWSGSGFFDDITVSPEGFAADPDPSEKPVGKTSRGYRPGPIPAGTWAAELGVAAVVPQSQGDLDGSVAWRVELRLERDPAFADEPYAPAPYDARPARRDAGWYAGDLHVHTEQSGDAKHGAPVPPVFDHAFRSAAEGGGELDFVQVTDHNTDSGWGEWGRWQSRFPGKLIARNQEITTYRGHVNAPGSLRLADYRTGRVLERLADGRLDELRGARPVREILDEVHAAGGVTQLNHPTIFDSAVPPFGIICRGCSWEYDDAETDFRRIDAIEVQTGPQGLKLDPVNPGPNPFTPLALDFYERALGLADRTIAAVSGSDSHSGGDAGPEDVTASPTGTPATMVYANDLSERSIAAAVEAGHTYVKAFGARSPDLRFEARAVGARGPSAIMGDTVRGARAEFTARVIGRGAGPEPLQLLVFRDGQVHRTAPVSGDGTTTFTADAPADGADRYRLQVMRGSAIEAVSSPIRLTRRPAPGAGRGGSARLRVRGAGPRRIVPRRGRRFRWRCIARGPVRVCRVAVRYRPDRSRRTRTIGRGRVRMTEGSARLTVRLTRAGRRALRRRGRLTVRMLTTALGDGHTARHARKRVLRRARPRRRAGADGVPALAGAARPPAPPRARATP